MILFYHFHHDLFSIFVDQMLPSLQLLCQNFPLSFATDSQMK